YFQELGRLAGVWVVRQGLMRFALPITTGTKPGVADYLPSPHGLPGFAAPVEQEYPALTPYIDLADGRTIVATDGADHIQASPDGQQLRVRWNRWAMVGNKSGELVDVGLSTEVIWRLKKNTLTREETLTATRPVNIQRWSLAVPTTYSITGMKANKQSRIDLFASTESRLEVEMEEINVPVTQRTESTENTPRGLGIHGAIPLHLVFESKNIVAVPSQPLRSKLTLTV